MKAYKLVKVTLELDEEETEWLDRLVHNYRLQSHSYTPDREEIIRTRFWTALENLRNESS